MSLTTCKSLSSLLNEVDKTVPLYNISYKIPEEQEQLVSRRSDSYWDKDLELQVWFSAYS